MPGGPYAARDTSKRSRNDGVRTLYRPICLASAWGPPRATKPAGAIRRTIPEVSSHQRPREIEAYRRGRAKASPWQRPYCPLLSAVRDDPSEPFEARPNCLSPGLLPSREPALPQRHAMRPHRQFTRVRRRGPTVMVIVTQPRFAGSSTAPNEGLQSQRPQIRGTHVADSQYGRQPDTSFAADASTIH